MSTGKKVIKIFAMIFGILLAIFVVAISIYALVVFGNSFHVDNLFKSEVFKNNNENVEIYKNNEVEIYGFQKSKSILNVNDVKKIEIDISYASLIVNSGEYENIGVYYGDNGNLSIKLELKNGILKITDEKKFSFFSNLDDEGIIEIYVPKNFIIDDFLVETGAGEVYIKDTNIRNLESKFGAGITTFENLNIDKASIKTGVGKVLISEVTIGKLELDSGIGKVEYFGKILDNSKIKTGIGSLNMNLDANYYDYNLDIESGIGSVNVNKGTLTKEESLNKKIKLDIESGMGSVNIKFN